MVIGEEVIVWLREGKLIMMIHIKYIYFYYIRVYIS